MIVVRLQCPGTFAGLRFQRNQWCWIRPASFLSQIRKALLRQVLVAMLFVDTCRIQRLRTIDANERAEDVRLLEINLDEISQPFLDVLYCLLNGGGGQTGRQWDLAVEVFLSG